MHNGGGLINCPRTFFQMAISPGHRVCRMEATLQADLLQLFTKPYIQKLVAGYIRPKHILLTLFINLFQEWSLLTILPWVWGDLEAAGTINSSTPTQATSGSPPLLGLINKTFFFFLVAFEVDNNCKRMQFLRENSGNYHKIALLRCYKNFYLDSSIVESVDVVCLETIYVAAVAAVKESCNEDFGGALCKEFI